jgi:hypothetical protein
MHPGASLVQRRDLLLLLLNQIDKVRWFLIRRKSFALCWAVSKKNEMRSGPAARQLFIISYENKNDYETRERKCIAEKVKE